MSVSGTTVIACVFLVCIRHMSGLFVLFRLGKKKAYAEVAEGSAAGADAILLMNNPFGSKMIL